MPTAPDPRTIAAVTSDGVTLSLRRFPAREPRRATALLTHAMMANGGYQARFARFASERGIDCFVLDFRGHGRSVPPSPRDPPGWSFDDYVERDLPAAIEAIGIAPGELSYVGHSLGGLVALAAAGTSRVAPFRRQCLVTTSVWRPGATGSRVRRVVGAGFDWLSRPLGYLPIRAFRVGTDDEPRGYSVQLAGWARSGRWTSLRGVDYLAALATISTPTLALVGARDLLCRERDVRDLTSRLAGPVRVEHVPGADHFGFFRRDAMWPMVCDHLIG